MKRLTVFGLFLLLSLPAAQAITITVVAKAKLLTMTNPELREKSESLDITTKSAGDPRCVSTGATTVTLDAGCQIDYSRTYTTGTTPQCDASLGQGGAGYGIVVDSCLQHDGAGGSHSLSGDTLTSSEEVCRKKNTTQRGWYKAKHILYEKCPTLEDWSQTYTYNYNPVGGAWQYVGTLSPPPPAGAQSLTYTISVAPSTFVTQSGLFSGDPNLSGDKGLNLWIKPGNNNDLQVTALEVTQGVQNLANDMPLVARRRTIVRAYVKATTTNVNAVRATLVASRNGVPVGAPLDAENTPPIRITGGTRRLLDDAYWFQLPPAWRDPAGPLKLTVTVDPDNTVPELDESNNSRETTVTFQPTAPLTITGVPFHMHLNADKNQPVLTFLQGDQNFWPIATDLLRFHPISTLMVFDCGTPIQYPAFHSAGHEWDLTNSGAVAEVLLRVGVVRALSDCTPDFTRWVGMIHPGVGTGGISGISIPTQRSSWVKMSTDHTGGAAWSIAGGETIAHELGHNAGLPHVRCDGSEGFPVWDLYPHPYPNCRLAAGDDGYYGVDVYYDLWGFSEPAVISNDPNAPAGSRAFPIMGYKEPAWADPFDYCLLLTLSGVPCNFLNTAKMAAPPPLIITETPAPRTFNPPASYIMADGIYDGHTDAFPLLEVAQVPRLSRNVINNPIVTATQPGDQTARRAPLFLVQIDATGKELASREIETLTTGGDPLVSPFLTIMPAAPGVSGIRIRRGTTTLVERRASKSKPVVHLLEPNGGPVAPKTTIKWTASDADNDSLSYTVLYSANGGRTWRPLATNLTEQSLSLNGIRLPGGTTAVIRVQASDGFNTGFDDSDAPLVVPTSPPVPSILQRDGLSVAFGRTLLLEGVAVDIDEGSITTPASFRWISDKDGVLGTGQELYTRKLSRNIHRITLEVRDQEGKAGTTSIRVYVGVPLPLERPAAAPVN